MGFSVRKFLDLRRTGNVIVVNINASDTEELFVIAVEWKLPENQYEESG
jgi:hypothetical protein